MQLPFINKLLIALKYGAAGTPNATSVENNVKAN